MKFMRHRLISAAAIFLSLTAAGAQQPSFNYPAPPASAYTISKDLQYQGAGGEALRMDVYRPAPAKPSPTIIFFNIASGTDRSNPFYSGWARLAASRGITAILPDLRDGSFAQDFSALIAHLATLTGDPTIDRSALADTSWWAPGR